MKPSNPIFVGTILVFGLGLIYQAKSDTLNANGISGFGNTDHESLEGFPQNFATVPDGETSGVPMAARSSQIEPIDDSGGQNFNNGLGIVGTANGGLDLSGAVSFVTSGNYVNISAERVSNFRTGGTSGSLRLRLWATSYYFTGGQLTGYILGTRELGTLMGGYELTNISGSVPFYYPPDGTYYIVLSLEEYTLGGWSLEDFYTFTTVQGWNYMALRAALAKDIKTTKKKIKLLKKKGKKRKAKKLSKKLKSLNRRLRSL